MGFVDLAIRLDKELAVFGGSNGYIKWVINQFSSMKVGSTLKSFVHSTTRLGFRTKKKNINGTSPPKPLVIHVLFLGTPLEKLPLIRHLV